MIPANNKDEQRTGESDKVIASAYADRPQPKITPPAPPVMHDQAARAVMHPDSYDPEWRYYHGAWGG